MTAQYILVVDDEPDIRNLLSEILEDEGYEVSVAENASQAKNIYRSRKTDLVLLDIWMPGEDGISLLKSWSENNNLCCPVIMMSGHATIETAVEATRLGAYDFIEKPLSLAKTLLTIEHALHASQLEQENKGLRKKVTRMQAPIGSSETILNLKKQAKQIAKHNTSVLFYGESGVGKEVFAQYIHSHSARTNRAFETASVNAMSHGDMGREIFGWEEAPDKIHFGLLDKASGGTLYLSNIANLDQETQLYLLTALKEKKFKRINGKEWLSLNTIIFTASDHDLRDDVELGSFNAELYYQLNIVPLLIPPLREHPEDIPELLNFYVDNLTVQEGLPYRHFSLPAQNFLRSHTWLGNIKELSNLVQRLLIIGADYEVNQDEVEEALGSQVPIYSYGIGKIPENLFDMPLRQAREQFEHDYLVYQLQQTKGNVSKLAERVKMERTHLYRKMRTLNIDPKKYGRN
jgi:DNA-binding NtrC family response regulator